MVSSKPRPWAELLQLVPVISLALPFVIQGSVDLAQAKSGFLIGALLSLPITGLVIAKKQALNPILIGTALWLWLGAIAFSVPIDAIATWLGQTQAFGLFVGALGVGILTTAVSPHGYIGCPSADAAWVRRSSLILLGVTVAAVVWAWFFRGDVRVGGGLPFIIINVTRRVICRRAPQ